jgi:hypothetical protein
MESHDAPALGGPFLAMAVLCERVLEERDGSLSLIRLVTRVTRSAQGPAVEETMPPFPLDLMLVLAFRAGAARGRSTITVRPETPSGLALPEMQLPIHWEGEERGPTLTVHLGFLVDQEGIYWFKVLLDGRFQTQVPLRVDYRPVS